MLHYKVKQGAPAETVMSAGTGLQHWSKDANRGRDVSNSKNANNIFDASIARMANTVRASGTEWTSGKTGMQERVGTHATAGMLARNARNRRVEISSRDSKNIREANTSA
jgi:hypothetical protein